MTKVWGPMGWMVLHSISVAYPDEPSQSEKMLLNEFMNAFANTITCINCRQHFGSIFAGYKRSVPTWANSKRDLFLAVCRLHNTVNKKIYKPTPKTVAECIASLKTATTYTNQFEFRKKYIEYLTKDWNTYGRATPYQSSALTSVKTMKKINEEYWNAKEVSYSNITFEEDDVLTYVNQPKNETIVFAPFKLRNVTWPRH
jgi:hypothetical protein